MNERIKELCSKAISDVDGIQNPDTQHMYIPDCFRDRFAEAVIRECCIALNPMLRDMISRGQGREIILQHFDINPKEISMLMLDRAIDQCKRELAERKNNETDQL
jgi:hypothetical protein